MRGPVIVALILIGSFMFVFGGSVMAQTVDLTAATAALTTANDQVASLRTAIIVLLSSLLAIALVVLLYKNIGGGK